MDAQQGRFCSKFVTFYFRSSCMEEVTRMKTAIRLKKNTAAPGFGLERVIVFVSARIVLGLLPSTRRCTDYL